MPPVHQEGAGERKLVHSGGLFFEGSIWRKQGLICHILPPYPHASAHLPLHCRVSCLRPDTVPRPCGCWHWGVPSRDRRDRAISQGCSANLGPGPAQHRQLVQVPLIPHEWAGVTHGLFLQKHGSEICRQPAVPSPNPGRKEGNGERDGLEGGMSQEEQSHTKGCPTSLGLLWGVFFSSFSFLSPQLSRKQGEKENKRNSGTWPSLTRRGCQMQPGSRSHRDGPAADPHPGPPWVPAGRA